MPELNPYEPPEVNSSPTAMPAEPRRAATTARDALQLLGTGVVIGVLFGLFACAVRGGAAGVYYLGFGFFGALVGAIAGIGGIVVGALIRLADRWVDRIMHRGVRGTAARHDRQDE